MWDWELLKNGSGKHRYEIIAQAGNEEYQYTHAVSYGGLEDEFCLHNHAMYEMVYCVGGDAVYLAEGEKYTLEPGGLLLIGPTVPHKLFIRSDTPFERHILYIYSIVGSSQMASHLSKSMPPVGSQRIGSAYYPPKDAQCLLRTLEQISDTARSPDGRIQSLVPIFAQTLAAELSIIFWSRKPEKTSQGTSKTVDTLLSFLGQNFSEQLTLQGIADIFHLSKDYCNRLFHTATGMTVMQYVRYLRVLHAKQLLAQGMPATAAADAVGFNDYSSFFRAYRSLTGRSPSDDSELAEAILEAPEG